MEKRRYQRLPREIAVDIFYIDSLTKEKREIERACSRNLSAVGLLVTTDKKLDLGANVRVEFYLPDSPELFSLNAKVIRAEELVHDKFFDLGLEFTDIDDTTLAKISALVLQDTSPA